MLASSTALNSSSLFTYTRRGEALSLFRSEPVQRVVNPPQVDNSDEQESGDTVSLSQEGLAKSRQQTGQPATSEEATASETTEEETASASAEQSTQKSDQPAGPQALTPEEEQVVQELKQRDQEVKTHEMAHLAVAGQYARGGASYTYQQGPDGRRYAIGGEVPIDMSEEKTPEETVQKMQAIKRAAMAPAEPSSADRSVAASATAMESRARQELQAETSDPAREQSADASAAPEESEAAATPSSNEEQQARQPLDVMA